MIMGSKGHRPVLLGLVATVATVTLAGCSGAAGGGASGELIRVVLPIVAPGIAAAALTCFIFAWNEYFLANLLTTTFARTTPPFLGILVDGRGRFLAILSAASSLAVLPVVVAGWIAQKRLVTGLAMGAVK
jgi:sorbitol/mannitol transport system permease protein